MHLQQLSAPSSLNTNVPCETSVIPERLPMSLREITTAWSDQRETRSGGPMLPVFTEGRLAGYRQSPEWPELGVMTFDK
jgi:hypothetical protein